MLKTSKINTENLFKNSMKHETIFYKPSNQTCQWIQFVTYDQHEKNIVPHQHLTSQFFAVN